jgi:23S rRNA (uracil1939-C5)-methyltransferase
MQPAHSVTNTAPPALRPGCEPRCPGCAHRALSAAASETQKQQWLRQKLADWRDRIEALRAPQGEARWAYRDRVCLKCVWEDGAWRIGMVRRHEVLAIHDCPVHSRRVHDALQALLAHLPGHGEFPLAWLVQSGAQLTLVLKTPEMPDTGWLTEDCREQLQRAGVEGLWLHLHPAAGRRIFHKQGWHLAWGAPGSVDADGMHYGPRGFQQLIPALYRQALDAAQAHLQPSPSTMVADLYSGGGSSLRRWSEAGAATLGVELGGQSCACAALNAPRATVLRGTCAQRIPQLEVWRRQADLQDRERLLYLNPPRTGVEAEVGDWIVDRYRPARIAYLSCSAGTLQRDLAQFTAAGYQVQNIIPFDFFPQTLHVETLALLCKCA